MFADEARLRWSSLDESTIRSKNSQSIGHEEFQGVLMSIIPIQEDRICITLVIKSKPIVR
jgi:hypothetical protein